MAKIGDLIQVEKDLLILDEVVGVPISMKIGLEKHLKAIGDVTSMYFKLLSGYHESVNDTNKTAEYQESLMDEEIEMNNELDSARAFLEKWKTLSDSLK